MDDDQLEEATAANERPTWRYPSDREAGLYVGADFGSDVSGFVVDGRDGEGPKLHTHPYSETFIVLEGKVRFRCGEEEIDAGAGDLVVAPPETPHMFTVVGPERCRMVTVHASAEMIQTDLE